MTEDGIGKMDGANDEDKGLDGGSQTVPLPETAPDERIAPGAVPAGTQQGGGRTPLRRGQKAGVAVAAACSVALIAVSAFFLVPSAVPDMAEHDALQTTAQVSGETDAPQGADGRAAEDVDGASSSEAEGAEAAAGEAASADAVAGASGIGSSASGAGGESSSSGASGSSGGSSSDSQPPAQSATVTVSVSVSSSAVGGPVSGGTTATFAQGATAYDALMACGLSVNASSGQYGVYVSAIGGLAEKEHGGKSGWVYTVNGADPGVSCSGYVLSDGDSVSWFYVTG